MSEIVPLPKKVRKESCPICRRASLATFRPFCSARCKDDDMRRWLTGAYRVPTDEVPEEPPEEQR
jgi:endogenous inhibitor of DNA gyrase (YacG/DUF329 family)